LIYRAKTFSGDNQPFFDKDNYCVVFHDGKKAECEGPENTRARVMDSIKN